MEASSPEPEPSPVAPHAGDGEAAPRPTRKQSAWRGAKRGFRIGAVVGGVLGALPLIPGLALTAFGLGAGHGWGIHPILLSGLAIFGFCAGIGTVLGAGAGLVAGREAAGPPIELAPERPGRTLWPWLVAAPVVITLAVFVAVGIYARRTVDRRLAAAVAAADRDDPHWRLDDLMANRRAVPDAQNGALVVAEVVATLPDPWPPAAGPAPGAPKPAPAGAKDVREAYDRLAAAPDNVRLDDATTAALRDALAACRKEVGLARTVADYQRGRHELVLGPTLIDTLLPETQASRNVARLLTADAAIRGQDGDPDGALDSCRAVLGVGRSIGDEPFLISQLVRVAIGAVGMQATRRALGQGEPSDAALARLQAVVLDELDQPLLLHGLRGERAVLDEAIRRIRDGELPIAALSSGPAPLAGASRGAIAPWGRLLFDNQRAVALDWMNEAVAIARRPAPERPALWDAWQARVDAVRKSRFGPFTASMAVLLTPAISSASQALCRYQAELGATAIVLAAERHRRRAGSWPASIAAIDPAILPRPPVDPFTGRPYRMEHRDGHLRVYSLGPNGRDEHGAYDPKKWPTGVSDDIGSGAWDVPLRRQAPR